MRRLRKRMALWLCMLLLLSMACNSALADVPQAGTESQQELSGGEDDTPEMDVELPTASDANATRPEEPESPTKDPADPAPQDPAEAEADGVLNEKPANNDFAMMSLDDGIMPIGELEEKQVRLYAGAEKKDLGQVTLKRDAEGHWTGVPDEPEGYNRPGWTYAGWYTGPIIEKYLDGGDPKPGTTGVTMESLPTLSQTLENLKKQLAGTKKWNEVGGSDEEITKLHHTWLVESEGQPVSEDQDLTEVSALYAMYTPDNVSINWDYNHWQGDKGTLRAGLEYGGYVYPPVMTHSEWGERVFQGWSLTENGKALVKEGTVYEVGKEPFTEAFFENGATLYAVWEGGPPRDVAEVKISIEPSDRVRHYNYGWRVALNYQVLPQEALYDSVTWGSDHPELVTIEPYGGSKNKATVYVSLDAKVDSVTITATADNGVKGSIELNLEHAWQQTYLYKATCQHDGYAVYLCSECGSRWQPKEKKTDHIYNRSYTAATCTEDGYEIDVCQYCGFTSKTVKEHAKGHNWTTQTVNSCSGAVTIRTCQTCGYMESDVDVNDAAHQWESFARVDKAATCSEAGSQSIHCAACGLTKDSTVIPANPELHAWRGWVVKKAAAVGVVGEEQRECHTCGQIQVREIPALVATPDSNVNTQVQAGDSGSSSGSSGGSSGGGGGGSGGSGGGGGGGGGGGSSNAKTGQSAAPNAAPAPTVVPGSGGAITQVVNVTANAAAAAGVANAQVTSGAWQQDAQGKWILRYSDGTVAANSWICVAEADGAHWYHFGGTGIMDTGWLNVDGKVYYLEANPVGNGRMLTGWQMLNGKWYYFSTASDATVGSLLTNTTTPDGYKVNALGEWIQ